MRSWRGFGSLPGGPWSPSSPAPSSMDAQPRGWHGGGSPAGSPGRASGRGRATSCSPGHRGASPGPSSRRRGLLGGAAVLLAAASLILFVARPEPPARLGPSYQAMIARRVAEGRAEGPAGADAAAGGAVEISSHETVAGKDTARTIAPGKDAVRTIAPGHDAARTIAPGTFTVEIGGGAAATERVDGGGGGGTAPAGVDASRGVGADDSVADVGADDSVADVGADDSVADVAAAGREGAAGGAAEGDVPSAAAAAAASAAAGKQPSAAVVRQEVEAQQQQGLQGQQSHDGLAGAPAVASAGSGETGGKMSGGADGSNGGGGAPAGGGAKLSRLRGVAAPRPDAGGGGGDAAAASSSAAGGGAAPAAAVSDVVFRYTVTRAAGSGRGGGSGSGREASEPAGAGGPPEGSLAVAAAAAPGVGSGALQQAREALARHTGGGIPRIIHQMYGLYDAAAASPAQSRADSSAGLSGGGRSVRSWAGGPEASVRSWRLRNPGYTHVMWGARDVEELVETMFPAFTPAFRSFRRLPVLRADLARYLVVFAFGGVYGDTDTMCLRPVDSWADGLDANVSAMVGIEADAGAIPGWERFWGRQLQFCQWAFAAEPAHPLLAAVVFRISQLLEGMVAERITVDDVIHVTGPSVMSDAVYDYLKSKGRDWSQFQGLTRAALVGDLLVLPITAFSPGVGHMGAGSVAHPEARVQHLFGGSWRKQGLGAEGGAGGRR